MAKQEARCPKCGPGTKVYQTGHVEIMVKYFKCQQCQSEFDNAAVFESILRSIIKSIEDKKEVKP